jgi:hypothetical protein
LLYKRIAEIEAEKEALQHIVDNGIEDYDLLLEGNKSLLAERDDFHYHCKDLWAELAEERSGAGKQIADLEAKIKFAKTHSADVAAAGEKSLQDFKDELVHDLA